MRYATLQLLFGCALLSWATGCDSKPSSPQADAKNGASAKLIGSWEGKDDSPIIVNGKEIPPKDGGMVFKMDFRADGTLTADMFFVMKGTWKLVKAEGKTLTIETTMEPPEEMKKDPGFKMETKTKTFSIVFDSDDEITMNPTDGKDQPLKFKRKK